jgi:hypothetical protein
MPALSPVKKERVGLEEQNGYKRRQDCKRGKTVSTGVLRKKLKHAVIQKYFFLKF